MNRRMALVASVVVVIGMLVASGLAWGTVPDRVPVHWGMNGEPDRYGGRIEGLLLLPAITTGLAVLLWGAPFIDPRRANLLKSESAYTAMCIATVAVLGVVHFAVIATATGRAVSMGAVMGISIGALFVVLGWAMRQVRSNFIFGVRTPWTLSSERSWERTHLLAGRLFVAGGMATIAAGVVTFVTGTEWLPVTTLLVTALGASLVSVVYSYVVWRGDPDRLGT